MSAAFVFPGQGAEEPGMGLDFAGPHLERASDVLGLDLRRALRRGSSAMARTEVIQVALVAVGFAAADAAVDAGLAPRFALGHSLGELTAAAWARGIPLDRALALAATRGRAMAELSEGGGGAMLAVRAREAQVEVPSALALAAVNAPDELVLSGARADLEAFAARCPFVCSPLRVAGAWHSAAMAPAVTVLRDAARDAFDEGALDGAATPRAEFVSTSRPEAGSDSDLPDLLARALVSTVRFAEGLVAAEARGATRFVAMAPSKVSRGMLRRCLGARARVESVDTRADAGRAAPPR